MSNQTIITDAEALKDAAIANAKKAGRIMVEETSYTTTRRRHMVPHFLDDGVTLYVCTGRGGSIKRRLTSAAILNDRSGLASFRFDD